MKLFYLRYYRYVAFAVVCKKNFETFSFPLLKQTNKQGRKGIITFVTNLFNMGFIIKVLVTALAVFVADYFLEGVHISDDIKTVVVVALVLALLNTFLKPILVLLTIPITIITLGLFLLVINILIVMLADYLIGGFNVDGWLNALLFSLIVSVVTYILDAILD